MTESEESSGCNFGLIEDTEPSHNQDFSEHVISDQSETIQLFSGHETPTVPRIDVEIECSQSECAEGGDFRVDQCLEVVSRLKQLFETMRVPIGTALLIEVKAAGSL